MTQFTYDEWKNRKSGKSEGKTFKVGYFNNLKDDGDTTIVRFAYDSSKEFIIQNVHIVNTDGKYKRVACIRDRFDAKDKCPLCASGDYAKSKAFVKVLEYTKDEDGNVVPSAKIWERPAGFFTDLLTAVSQAKDLGICPMDCKISDIVFKVTRNGAKGSKDTKYAVQPANPTIYKAEIYTKDFSAFDGLDLSHHSYWVKTEEELKQFIETGEFPAPAQKEEEDTVAAAETSGAVAGEEFPSSAAKTSVGRPYSF